jgi:pimeloyl-ACP methyl ester carboxylesterase
MNRTRFIGALLSVSLILGCSGAPSPVEDDAIDTTAAALQASGITFDVTLRDTGSATLHASVQVNPRGRSGANVLVLHGFQETGFAFRPLAQAIFQDRVLGRTVKRVIALDLPGHGDSAFPTNLPNGVRFGDLTLDDNVSMVLQVIDALDDLGLAPRVVMGHSVGGLELQAAQEALLAQHSSLAAHGVVGAVLLAPVPPHGLPWHMAPARPGDPTPSVVNDPVLGSYLSITPEAFIFGFFRTPAGQVIPGAPTQAEVVAARYIAPEPLSAILQLVEAPVPLPTGETITVPRPTVSPGAFALRHGTLLSLVSFNQDTAVPTGDVRGLYEYLTLDTRDRFYRPVSAPDAVHCMLISNPTGLLDAIRPML